MGGVEPPGDLIPHLEEMGDVLAKIAHLFDLMDHHLFYLQRSLAEDALWGETDAADDLSHTLIELEGLTPNLTDHQCILVEEVRHSVNSLIDDIHSYEAHSALYDFEHKYAELKESFVWTS